MAAPVDVRNGVVGKIPANNIGQLPALLVNSVSASTYTFKPSDAQGYALFTSACVATVPANTFAVGAQLTCEQGGSGAVTLTPAAGVTFNPTGNRVTTGQYAVVGLMQKTSNVWTVFGNFA